MKRSYNPWTDADDHEILKSGDIGELAKSLGRPRKHILDRRHILAKRGHEVPTVLLGGAAAPAALPKGQDYKEDRQFAAETHWRDEYGKLHHKYHQLLKEGALVDRLIADIQEVAPRSYDPAPPISVARKQSKSSPQSAVLMLSDTHIGKVTDLSQTLGFRRYDFSVFLAQLKYVEDSIISILRDHVNTEVSELVVAMLGDMLDGALDHCAEAANHNTIFTQCYAGAHAVAQFLRNLSAHVPNIRVETVVGNHTRFQGQRKMPTENRYSNFDMFFYALVEALTRDIPGIRWNLNKQPFQIFDVQGFVFHASHGDHWRGGDKALGIPNHAIGRQISTTVQLFTKHGAPNPNYYIAGHLHRSINLPHALGEVLINGGFPGLDNYALEQNFNPVDPIQRFFMVHPKYGRAASYDLCLKFAKVAKEPPYQIPGEFPAV